MDLESKLDEDFLFYLGFTNSFLQRVTDDEMKHKCEQWLRKLIGEPCFGAQSKRYRNIYLSQLLIRMQAGSLDGPFLLSPADVDIANAMEVFQPIPESIEAPGWLSEVDGLPEKVKEPKDGRTYIATRTLPGGQGAFAYIAVSLAEEEPRWLGGGEGRLESHLSRKFRDKIPPIYEMEKILARRKDPKEREKVLTFYDVLLRNIADEMDGVVPPEKNETINGLLEQLIQDLIAKGEYDYYEDLPDMKRRKQLLIILHDRVQSRRNKVAKREEILDDIEERILPKSFFETSVLPEERFELPAAMWEQAINKAPNKKNLEKLYGMYPVSVVEKFLVLLSNQKEEIAVIMQKRHENIVSQMKKELKREGEKGKKEVDDVQKEWNFIAEILKTVKDHYQKKVAVEQKNAELRKAEMSEHSKLYEQMRNAIFDTQKNVEDEAAKGRLLAAQINAVTEQNELFHQVNKDSVKKAEEANMQIMKNIKRLNVAIGQYESRITTIQKMATDSNKGGAAMMFF